MAMQRTLKDDKELYKILSVSDHRDNSATMRAIMALALAQYEDLF